MSSPDVLEILKAWKHAELGIFMFWASSIDKNPKVSFSFEGRIGDAEGLIVVIGEPSTRIDGTLRQQASISLADAIPSIVKPERVRFDFTSGAVLEMFLS